MLLSTSLLGQVHSRESRFQQASQPETKIMCLVIQLSEDLWRSDLPKDKTRKSSRIMGMPVFCIYECYFFACEHLVNVELQGAQCYINWQICVVQLHLLTKWGQVHILSLIGWVGDGLSFTCESSGDWLGHRHGWRRASGMGYLSKLQRTLARRGFPLETHTPSSLPKSRKLSILSFKVLSKPPKSSSKAPCASSLPHSLRTCSSLPQWHPDQCPSLPAPFLLLGSTFLTHTSWHGGN